MSCAGRYYIGHPAEARAIAKRGYLHALRHHRAVSRMDFFLRSAHDQELAQAAEGPGAAAAGQHAYEHTGRSIHRDPALAMLVNPKPEAWSR